MKTQALIAKLSSDGAGLNNLALAYNMWNFPRALELGKAAVGGDLSGNVLRQSNVALYALYAGD